MAARPKPYQLVGRFGIAGQHTVGPSPGLEFQHGAVHSHAGCGCGTTRSVARRGPALAKSVFQPVCAQSILFPSLAECLAH